MVFNGSKMDDLGVPPFQETSRLVQEYHVHNPHWAPKKTQLIRTMEETYLALRVAGNALRGSDMNSMTVISQHESLVTLRRLIVRDLEFLVIKLYLVIINYARKREYISTTR